MFPIYLNHCSVLFNTKASMKMIYVIFSHGRVIRAILNDMVSVSLSDWLAETIPWLIVLFKG